MSRQSMVNDQIAGFPGRPRRQHTIHIDRGLNLLSIASIAAINAAIDFKIFGYLGVQTVLLELPLGWTLVVPLGPRPPTSIRTSAGLELVSASIAVGGVCTPVLTLLLLVPSPSAISGGS